MLFRSNGEMIILQGKAYLCLLTEAFMKVNGEMEDRGIINYDNGDIYTGQIKNFKKHGFGELSFANGDRYIGDF